MRHILIDTDTGSDDAMAIVMALKCKDVKVEALTVVNGNVPTDLGVKNALISIDWAGTYKPPVYEGMDRPLLRDIQHAFETHGDDGMGDMDLDWPEQKVSEGNGVLKLLEYADKFAGELEIVALGPLTNIAMAYLLDHSFAKKVKRLYVMGTAGYGPGNVTPVAEFNIWADPEACDIVLNSGMDQLYIGWDMCTGPAMITTEEIEDIEQNGTDCAKKCIRCNKTLMEMNTRRFGSKCLDMADPVAMAVALWPDQVCKENIYAYTYCETAKGPSYGMVVSDYSGAAEREANAGMCKSIHIDVMKKLMLDHIK